MIKDLLLDRESVKKLTEVNDRYFYKKLGVLMLILFISCWLILSSSLLLSVLGMILAGVMYAHAVELQHQCIHHTAFKKPALNTVFGILLGAPMLVSFSQYRSTHLKHHKQLGSSEDEEFFDGRFKRYMEVFSLKKRSYTETIVLLFLPIFSIILLCFNNTALLKIWLLPVLLFAELAHYLIELPEHHRCEKNEKSPLQNTRTIVGSKFSFWLTNGNNFHVEHHALAAVPVNNLPKLLWYYGGFTLVVFFFNWHC